MIVVSDTSPLNYLALLGHIDVLPKLYGRVIIPDVVLQELTHANSPKAVLNWAKGLPLWVEVIPTERPAPYAAGVDVGEAAAISISLTLNADLLLLDDRPARAEARRLGLAVTGLLGVLVAASVRGLVEIEVVLGRLQYETNFRLTHDLAEQVMSQVRMRRRTGGDEHGETTA